MSNFKSQIGNLNFNQTIGGQIVICLYQNEKFDVKMQAWM